MFSEIYAKSLFNSEFHTIEVKKKLQLWKPIHINEKATVRDSEFIVQIYHRWRTLTTLFRLKFQSLFNR